MIIGYIVLGIVAGVLSGFLGIGGGTIIIPVIVLLFGMTQHQAQGTTLALMIPPIGLLAAWRYYAAGNVNIKMAAFICCGFFIGGLIGAHFVHFIPESILKKMFGGFLFVVALRMIFL